MKIFMLCIAAVCAAIALYISNTYPTMHDEIMRRVNAGILAYQQVDKLEELKTVWLYHKIAWSTCAIFAVGAFALWWKGESNKPVPGKETS